MTAMVNDDHMMNAVVNNHSVPAMMDNDNGCVGSRGSDSAEGDRCPEDEG